MGDMDKKKINRLIAREGLIVLGLGIVLYLALSAAANISVPLLKYRLEFDNGKSYVILISPDLSQGFNKKKLIRDSLNPSPRLISRRIDEFIKDNRIDSKLKYAQPVNNRQVGFHKFLFSFFSFNFLTKLFIIYLVLLAARFVIWAAGILKEK